MRFLSRFLTLLVIAPVLSFGQGLPADSNYFNEIKRIEGIGGVSAIKEITDTAAKRKRLSEAVDAYLALAKKYKINCGQLKSFIASSLLGERSDGLLVAVPAIMMLLGEPASDILKTETEFASQVYKLPVRIEASPSLVKAQQTLEKMSDSILMEARKALDWQAILMLNSNFHSDMEYRVEIPHKVSM